MIDTSCSKVVSVKSGGVTVITDTCSKVVSVRKGGVVSLL